METVTEHPFGDAVALVHRIEADERPANDDRPIFALVHGLGMGAQYWQPLGERLSHHGTVLALDLPGFGDAPEPDEPPSIQVSGDALAACLTAADLANPHRQLVLVGHSMGTQISAEAAARHPELTQRLVLIAPTINAAERTLAWQAWRMMQDVITAGPKVWWVGTWSYIKVGPRWFIGKLRTMLKHQIEATLPTIQANTLVIRAERDKVCPRDWVEQVTALIPTATMREVKGRGHETIVTRADDVARLIAQHANVGPPRR